MIDPNRPGDRGIGSTPEQRAKQKASEFVRETRYKTLLRGGLNPQQAANMMGVRFRSGDKFKASDILRMIIKGRGQKDQA